MLQSFSIYWDDLSERAKEDLIADGFRPHDNMEYTPLAIIEIEIKDHYTYDPQLRLGGGLELAAPDGRTIFIQGDEAAALYDELEDMNERQVDETLEEYFGCLDTED